VVELAGHGGRLVPLPKLERPSPSQSSSSRLRHRHRRHVGVWRVASRYLNTINALDRGLRPRQTLQRPTLNPTVELRAAWKQVHATALAEAVVYERRRRGLTVPSGVHAVAALVRGSLVGGDGYLRARQPAAREELSAAMVDEPLDERCVIMIDALPADDAMFYSKEEHVLDYSGKSSIIFNEIETRHCFVGGSQDQYIQYLTRSDLPRGALPLWRFVPVSQVKAYAGLTVVPKKTAGRQRKILMQCAANYAWSDPSARANLGMLGGSALGALHAPDDEWAVASFDENNAFTRVVPPAWMHLWCCAPPVVAALVWGVLDAALRATLSPSDLVAPAYCRLAMGSAHAVAILMSINLCTIGRALISSRRLTM
jgi:hypothetical protein